MTLITLLLLFISVCVAFIVITSTLNEINNDSFDIALEDSYDQIESINSTVDQNYTQGWIDALEYVRSRYMYNQNVTMNSFKDIANQTV